MKMIKEEAAKQGSRLGMLRLYYLFCGLQPILTVFAISAGSEQFGGSGLGIFIGLLCVLLACGLIIGIVGLYWLYSAIVNKRHILPPLLSTLVGIGPSLLFGFYINIANHGF